MITIDMRCTMRQCKDKSGIYRMVGKCSNCGTEPILFLITADHEAPSSPTSGQRCPVCGCSKAFAQRLATDDEIPVG
jgi:hypothetical protein